MIYQISWNCYFFWLPLTELKGLRSYWINWTHHYYRSLKIFLLLLLIQIFIGYWKAVQDCLLQLKRSISMNLLRVLWKIWKNQDSEITLGLLKYSILKLPFENMIISLMKSSTWLLIKLLRLSNHFSLMTCRCSPKF